MEIKNLAKGYGLGHVIKDISVSMKPGIIYGLIGPNGSGKSTLLRCMTGIYKPDEGTVQVSEKNIFQNDDIKKHIAYVQDHPVFNFNFNVKKQMNYYQCFYDDFSVTEFEKLLEIFSINKKMVINNLSLGQKKKIALALAFSRKSQYLILDEPENGLDNEARILIKTLLREKAESGCCILIASHDLNNIEELCDEIIFMNHGQVLIQKSIETLFENVSKWSVKSDRTSFTDAIVLDAEGGFAKIIVYGNKNTARDRLEKEGVEILNAEKVTLLDAYMIYQEVEKNE